jgi:hypothetical protein
VLQLVWDAYASGLVVDIAIGFTVLELGGLLAWHRLTGRGLAPADYALNMLSGLCLMLALRSALLAFWIGVALCLIAAGTLHITDLVLRLRRKQSP